MKCLEAVQQVCGCCLIQRRKSERMAMTLPVHLGVCVSDIRCFQDQISD